MSRTKILATLGPATNSPEVIRELIKNGLNAVRLNFSHGSPEDHQKRAQMVRDAAKELGAVVAILADLQGPKIRISRFREGQVNLAVGDAFILDAELDKNAGDETKVGIDYETLPHEVKAGDVLLLDDGRVVFEIDRVEGNKIHCVVKVGGVLSNSKGINLQGGGLSAPALTDKDKKDLKTAVAINADFIAISFPRSAEDMLEARRLMEAEGGHAGLIAKVERAEAVIPEILDGIIEASDGIMVARGDLGVEIGVAEVPAVQKYMIRRCLELNKPVVTATQMMETMIHNVIPTRAEVSDVANAVLDGTDAVMLSAETATGEHPALVVKAMHDVCVATEKHPITYGELRSENVNIERVDEAICMATMFSAHHLKVTAILAFTESGNTPLWMSRVRSPVPIYGFARDANTLGKMALYRNVYPIYFDVTKYPDSSVLKHEAICELEKRGLVSKGDLIIVIRGPHGAIQGCTNSMTIVKVEGESC